MLDPSNDLEKAVAHLDTASERDLILHWRNLMRSPYPSGLPRSLILRILAYQLQAEGLGDLSKASISLLASIAKATDARPSAVLAASQTHMPGTQYEREYGGVRHLVSKTDSGFRWRDKDYASLSAVAYAITGTRWNGPRFFGVNSPGVRSDAGA